MRRGILLFGLIILVCSSLGAAAESDGQEGGSVSVSIDDYCRVDITELQAPGFAGVIGYGQNGTWEYEVKNEGSLVQNVSLDLNVTYEGEGGPWEPGQPVGGQVANYTEGYTDVPTTASPNDTAVRNGTAEFTPFQTGYFTGRLTVEAQCAGGKNDTAFTYADLVVVDAGGAGGSQVGDPETNITQPSDADQTSGSTNATSNQTSGNLPADANQSQGSTNATSNQTSGNIPTDVNQTQGSTNATSNQSVGNQPENVNATEGNITREANQTQGNVPADVNDRDGQLDRNDEQDGETFPQDAEEVGEESDITEGNNDAPGQTPTPQPEPTPVLSVEMQPWNDTYRTARDQFADIRLRVSNTVNETLQDIDIRPRLGSLEGNWTGRPVTIESLEDDAVLNRSVFVQPGTNVEPGYYAFPVVAYASDGRAIAAEYIDIRVRQEIFESQMEIAEAPSRVRVERNGTTTIPVLIRNIGRSRLQNVTAQLQDVEGIGSVRATSIERVEINGTAGLRVQFNATGNDFATANATLVVSSSEGAYSFANVELSPAAVDDEGVVPQQFRMPIVATVWTILLILYALLTKFYDLDSLLVRIPFVLLILGEVTLMLYVASEYYGFSSALLPF